MTCSGQTQLEQLDWKLFVVISPNSLSVSYESRPGREPLRRRLPVHFAGRGKVQAKDTGQSVSMSNRLSGTWRATSRRFSAFLKVSTPANEIRKPSSNVASARLREPEKRMHDAA